MAWTWRSCEACAKAGRDKPGGLASLPSNGHFHTGSMTTGRARNMRRDSFAGRPTMCSYGVMSTTLRILWLQCVLLASTAVVNAAPATDTAAHLAPPATALVSPPSAAPANPGSTTAAPQPLSPEDLLFACPTSLDHIGRIVASVMVDGRGPFRFIIDSGANHSTISPHLVAV